MFTTQRRGGALSIKAVMLAGFFLSAGFARAAGPGADAVVVVNSASAKYPDFQHFVQPYLDNFGVPYTVLDIASNPVPADIGRHALIIIGHGQLDTNQVYLTATAQSNILNAISIGSGLVNFDGALTNGVGTNGFPYVQSLFGFGYGSAATAATVTFPATGASNQLHFITARHTTNDTLILSNSMSLPGVTFGTNVTAIALGSGKPFVMVAKYGFGRAVQFGSSDWMSISVLGPVNGMDDVVWRSFVWAARKPFVMRGMPAFATMRVDDVSGPFTWVHTANQAGFKPYIALFFSNVSSSDADDLRGIVTNGNATTSIHSFTDTSFFYFDHAHGTAYPDSVVSNNFVQGTEWHATHGIPISKMMIAHWSEMGTNVFAGLKAWGIEYVLIEVEPGTREYYEPYPPWLMLGPYRLYENPGQGQSLNPMVYADFLKIPGHPEFDGQFFDPYTEIRNVLPSPTYDLLDGGDWAPDTNVSNTVYRATQQIKRGLDSLTLGNVFTHEKYIDSIPNSTWLSILQGVSNNLAPYNPAYVTMDYANQYLRATRTSRITSSQYDIVSGGVKVGLSGKTDLNINVQVYTGQDNSITNTPGPVPVFNGSTNITVAFSPPPPPLLKGEVQGDQLVLSFNAVPWQDYIVAETYDINSGSWSVLTNITAQGTNVVCADEIINGGRCFYRVLLPAVDPGIPALTAQLQNGAVVLAFNARPGANYTIQYADAPASPWATLTNVTAAVIHSTVSDAPTNTQRFYRIGTPKP